MHQMLCRFFYDGKTAGVTFIAGTSSKRSPPSGVTLTVAEKHATEKQVRQHAMTNELILLPATRKVPRSSWIFLEE